VKHAHHEFDIDHPGKDSYELRKAGATQVIVGSGKRWAMIVESSAARDPELTDLLQRLALGSIDLILVEGFRDDKFPKVEVHRKSLERPLFYPIDDFIIAIATDDVATHTNALTAIDLEEVGALADFLVEYCAAATRV
jgi:molybdopterin-guanine dinucleotide biosynthesis protein MobB